MDREHKILACLYRKTVYTTHDEDFPDEDEEEGKDVVVSLALDDEYCPAGYQVLYRERLSLFSSSTGRVILNVFMVTLLDNTVARSLSQ
jgi:hypothetical protein